MKIFFSFTVLLTIYLISSIANAQELGHLQIKSDPGVNIFLNGDFQGLTKSDIGGLIIQSLEPGDYDLMATKEGFNPIETNIVVNSGQVTSHTLSSFVPRVVVEQSGDNNVDDVVRQTGWIQIQSLPIEATVKIQGLSISQNKTKDKFSISDVPVGEYNIELEFGNERLNRRVEVKNSKESQLFYNFIEKTISEKIVDKINEDNLEAKNTGQLSVKNKFNSNGCEFTKGNYNEILRRLDVSLINGANDVHFKVGDVEENSTCYFFGFRKNDVIIGYEVLKFGHLISFSEDRDLTYMLRHSRRSHLEREIFLIRNGSIVNLKI